MIVNEQPINLMIDVVRNGVETDVVAEAEARLENRNQL